MKNLKTFEQMFETENHVDEFLGLNKLRDKVAGVKKFAIDKFTPSAEAKEFVRRNVSKYKEVLADAKVPSNLIINAIMALYDFAEGVPLLDRLHVEYDAASKNFNRRPLIKRKKGSFLLVVR